MPQSGDGAITVALAEYAALRAEIDRRSQAQQTLVNLALTLSGALAAYAITREAVAVLLLQPIVASSLGLLYADHGAAIRRIGRYLDRSTAEVVTGAVGEPRLMLWERLAARREGYWRPIWLSPPLTIFVGSSLLTLIAGASARVYAPIAVGSRLLTVPLAVVVVEWLAGLAVTMAAAIAFYGAYARNGLAGFDEALDAAERDREPGRAV